MLFGQNKGKSRCWHKPKIKIFNIGFDTWIPIDKKPLLASILSFKMMDFETLNFCTFWGPSLSDFEKLDKITDFAWFIS